MAKAQKRSSKEIRKPKAVKTNASSAPAGLMTMAVSGAPGAPKKKG